MTDNNRDVEDLSGNTHPVNTQFSSLQFDHLVVAAGSLKAGIDHVQNQLKVPLELGGQHHIMGTHNALLKLGTNCYLEVIAIDRSLPKPQRSRWFSLDEPEIRNQIAKVPRLIHWVVRTTDFNHLGFKIPASLRRIINMSRGQLRWKITVPDSGALPDYSVLPSLIQRISSPHPASLCRTKAVDLTH